jgi:hypothetical protein
MMITVQQVLVSLQHVAERPVLGPSRVDFIAHALITDVGREAYA